MCFIVDVSASSYNDWGNSKCLYLVLSLLGGSSLLSSLLPSLNHKSVMAVYFLVESDSSLFLVEADFTVEEDERICGKELGELGSHKGLEKPGNGTHGRIRSSCI